MLSRPACSRQSQAGKVEQLKMGIQDFSEDVLLVNLPLECSRIGNELKNLNETILAKENCDVVIDFSIVELITSSDISNLLTLRTLLQERGHRLILCSVPTLTKGIFTVAGLDAVFEFADDKDAALAAIQHTK
jgi:anti-anti-sigma regulatory factor